MSARAGARRTTRRGALMAGPVDRRARRCRAPPPPGGTGPRSWEHRRPGSPTTTSQAQSTDQVKRISPGHRVISHRPLDPYLDGSPTSRPPAPPSVRPCCSALLCECRGTTHRQPSICSTGGWHVDRRGPGPLRRTLTPESELCSPRAASSTGSCSGSATSIEKLALEALGPRGGIVSPDLCVCGRQRTRWVNRRHLFGSPRRATDCRLGCRCSVHLLCLVCEPRRGLAPGLRSGARDPTNLVIDGYWLRRRLWSGGADCNRTGTGNSRQFPTPWVPPGVAWDPPTLWMSSPRACRSPTLVGASSVRLLCCPRRPLSGRRGPISCDGRSPGD